MNTTVDVNNALVIPSTSVVREQDWAVPSIALRSMFWRPSYIAASAWVEHVPFAFWLVDAVRPRSIVELGSHYGTSYFAMCQAVDRLGLVSSCYAVDTWKGDEHAGFYGDEVYKQVSQHNGRMYSGFSTLVRSTFDQALAHFPDGSVDLLHIDGLHTEDAVTHDFESWLPKMSDRGVVIFHDINVRERGFGVYKFFEAICRKFPHFSFAHGHGLGLVAVGRNPPPLVGALCRAQREDLAHAQIQEVFSRLGRACAGELEVINANAKHEKIHEDYKVARAQLGEARQALEQSRSEASLRSRETADIRKRYNEQVERSALERGQYEERIKLLEGLRQELKDEVRALRESADVAVSIPLPTSESLPTAKESSGDLEKLQGQARELHRRLNERFNEVALLTKLVTQQERDIAAGRSGVAEQSRKVEAQAAEILQLRGELNGAHVALQGAIAEVGALKGSTCWRITKPLRFTVTVAKRMTGRA